MIRAEITLGSLNMERMTFPVHVPADVSAEEVCRVALL
jgi:hypothetical protein